MKAVATVVTISIGDSGVTRHVYDAVGQRVLRVDPDRSKTLYPGASELRWTPGSASVDVARHYPGGTHRQFDGSLTYTVAGHQDSIIASVDATSGAIDHNRYLPYGALGDGSTVDDKGFLNQTHDDATNLIYLNNRHHDPTLGSFVSVDPLVTMTGEPYIYGSANPVVHSDVSGLFSCFVPGDPWACLDLSATISDPTPAPTNRRDPTSPSPTAVRGEDVKHRHFVVRWRSSTDLEQIGPTVENLGDGRVLVYDPDGTIGLSITICPALCFSLRVFLGEERPQGFVEIGQYGVGGSLNAHVTSKSACEQEGTALSASYAHVYGGGASVAANVDGGSYHVDPTNVDVMGSVGFKYTPPVLSGVGKALGAGGGPSHTWVEGC